MGEKIMPSFDAIYNNTRMFEGGYSNHPNDRGGETINGISSKNWPKEFAKVKGLLDEGKTSEAESYMRDFYQNNFWGPSGAENAPPEMQPLLFDAAVNHGVGAAKKILASSGGDPNQFLNERQAYMDKIVQNDPSQAVFQEGWENRVNAQRGYGSELPEGAILDELPEGAILDPSYDFGYGEGQDKPLDMSTPEYVARGLLDYYRGVTDQALQGIPFTDELAYAVDRGISGKEKADARRENYLARINKFEQDNPVTSVASQIGYGMLAGGQAATGLSSVAPKLTGTIAGIAKSSPKLASIGVGAGGTGLYAAGKSEGDIGERAAEGFEAAPFGGVAGLGGYYLARGAQKGIGYVGNKFSGAFPEASSKVASTLSNLVDDIQETTPTRLAGILDENQIAKLENGSVLPMTKGDRTQNVAMQRAEDIALKSGSQPIIDARAIQQNEAYKPFQGVLGDNQIMQPVELDLRAQQEAKRAADIIRGQYDSLGNKVNRAYEIAREGSNGIGISADAVKNDLIGGVNNILSERSYRKGDIPNLDKHIDELQSILKPSEQDGAKFNVTSLSLKSLEEWKKRLNQINFNSDQVSPDSSMAIKTMVGRHYDDFLTNLADDAIVNGDQTAINAFKNARSLARQKFSFYDSDKSIQRILDTRELSGQQLVNTIFGSGKLSGKGEDGLLTSKMISMAGDKAPEMVSALQQGAMAKVLKGSISSNVNPSDQTLNLINFGNMRKEVGNIMTNKEFFETVFDGTEQKYWKSLHDDLRLISSKQSGAINPSGTASHMADMLLGLSRVVNNPLMSPAKSALVKWGESALTGKAEKGLSEFMVNSINSIDTQPVFWGGYMGGVYGPEIGGILLKEDGAYDNGN